VKSKNVFFNILAILATGIFAIAVARFAYGAPNTVLAVTGTAVTSISIIFGLSLSLVTLASQQIKISEQVVPRLETRKGVEADLANENDRTILRQKLAVSVLMLSVALGMIFLGVSEHDPLSIWRNVVGSAFAFFTTLSISLAFVLPFSISATIRRNNYFSPSQ
jgi:hypothetical protein